MPFGSKPVRLPSGNTYFIPFAPMTPEKLSDCIAARIFSLSVDPARLIASATMRMPS
jgi:hypothetical protein